MRLFERIIHCCVVKIEAKQTKNINALENFKYLQMKSAYLEKRKEHNHETVTTARPRRLSEVSIKTTAKPLPKEKAFFLISHTNR